MGQSRRIALVRQRVGQRVWQRSWQRVCARVRRSRPVALSLGFLAAVVAISSVAATDGLVLWVAIQLAFAAVALSILVQVAGFDPDARPMAERLAAHPEQQRLLTRWIARARWARSIGGLCGVIVWAIGTWFQGNLLVCGMAGIAAGAVAAEAHHLRRPRGRRIVAIDDVRTVGRYLLDQDARRMRLAAAFGGAAAACGLVVPGAPAASIGYGLAAASAIGLAVLAQRRVVRRPRPALPPDLRRADDLVRELAIGRGLARPFTYLSLALTSQACFELGAGDAPFPFELLGVAAGLYAILLWWVNRGLGLQFLLDEPTRPVVA